MIGTGAAPLLSLAGRRCRPPGSPGAEEEAMPVYQYECTPCLVVYEVLHGMNDPPLESCQRCGGSVTRLISAPRINRHNFSGPTEAKYAKVSPQQEVAKERDLQRVYERIWLPPPVKHEPWD
jgi:putative FmdB family regulatory protein